MVTTICFVDDLKKTFLEASRVLKDDGFIDKDSKPGEVYRRNKNKSHFYNIAKFFSTEEILACLSKAGFSKFEIKQTIFPENTRQLSDGFGIGSFVVIKGLKM